MVVFGVLHNWASVKLPAAGQAEYSVARLTLNE
jgi:hypothetical protein